MKSRLWDTFSDLIQIDSVSFMERELCDELKKRLEQLGIETKEDGAGRQIEGNCGNLFGFLPGALPLEPVLLSAHMDTVEPGQGKRAIFQDEDKIISEGETVLGADDVAGIAVILEAITRLRETNMPHRPIELLFSVAEERYCLGSAYADHTKIQAKECYLLDQPGTIGKAANAGPTVLSFSVTIEGKAAHAGFAPQDGIHAILVASRAISRISLGGVAPGVTVNIGLIEGGTANNIVPECCVVTGEIRSIVHEECIEKWRKIKGIFEEEANEMRAKVTFTDKIVTTAFETPFHASVVTRFQKACEQLEIPSEINYTLGVSDQNNFALHGIEGLVLACSMHKVHSTDEYARLSEMEQCVELLMLLLTED